jgi:hypothetical protein
MADESTEVTRPVTPPPESATQEPLATHPQEQPSQPQDETALLRDLIVRAHPDVVPELIRGTSLAEMLASLPEAQAVYARILARSGGAAHPAPTHVPAGSAIRTPPIDAATLSPMAKIAAGIRGR